MQTQEIAIPTGFKKVTKDQFFAALSADRRDIMPTPQRMYTDWFVVHGRIAWGWVSEGWANSSDTATYCLRA